MLNKIKQIRWRRVVYILAWGVSLIGLSVLMSFINTKKSNMTCAKVNVIVPGTQAFVSQMEVNNIVEETGGVLIGQTLKNIPIHRIEDGLRSNPFIKEVKVFSEIDGTVNVKIEQREAILRIINNVGNDFYVDVDGMKFPTSALYAPHIIVANGNIEERFTGEQDSVQSALAEDLYSVASFLVTDSLWNSQIEQLYVNEEKDIELVPRVGDQKIVLGNGDSLQTKFDKLLVFYKHVVPKAGWGTYKTVNLKFSNQLVCEKADSIIQREKNNKQHINTH
ncbi:cell division protein FtsQ [Olivibacter sp. SDN3]|uniref:cell division protein FtsQ/DivIB n=1 Tax=Olivibacter sp. SDN3 TaxID=2764720 RepID=UPI00165165D9|nr:cell division protein FtsQ [Olivibacter sp. SDN3]QNL50116.1 cell division protein FtsQ [Olivibacter sp. SDN3]